MPNASTSTVADDRIADVAQRDLPAHRLGRTGDAEFGGQQRRPRAEAVDRSRSARV
jgi:hypothetical protein